MENPVPSRTPGPTARLLMDEPPLGDDRPVLKRQRRQNQDLPMGRGRVYARLSGLLLVPGFGALVFARDTAGTIIGVTLIVIAFAIIGVAVYSGMKARN
jgi:hypothetical protein